MSDDDVTEEEAGSLVEYSKYQARVIERYRGELSAIKAVASEILTIPVREAGIVVSVPLRRRLQIAVHEPAKLVVKPAEPHPLFADLGDSRPNPRRRTPRTKPSEPSSGDRDG